MRYKLTIAYDGNNYLGFQSQPHKNTIQDEIERVLKQIFSEDIRIIMASRTDAGVHAKGQVLHFDVNKKVDPFKLKGSINALLKKDIHVLDVKRVKDSFHARFSVKSKTYEYLINNGEYDVFLNGYAYQCFYKLDLDKMIECSKLFLGTHDFSSFNTSTYEEKPDQHRTITEFKITKKKGLIKIRVTGDGFMRNMVRILVGTLVDVARGKKEIEDVKYMLDHPDKSTKRYNASPSGLYLVKIRY